MTESAGVRLGETLARKYRVRRLIGEGGMGVVYEVEHALTKRVGALKLLHESYASVEPVVQRFIREASAAGRIGNPHIVEAFDAGELPSGEPYLFMELLSGEPLTERIRRRGRLSFEEAREIVAQAAEGLSAAHAAQIVHRDIKPDNLFVCAGDPSFVKILDFGISKFAPQHELEARLTKEGAPLGTPHYMSPEQVSGKRDVDARTDVYSLAVVLYECVAGHVPFDAETLPALSIKIFEGGFTPVCAVVHDAPIGLDDFLRCAMAVEPSRRYPTMAAFREALLGLGSRAQISFAPTLPGAHEAQVPGPSRAGHTPGAAIPALKIAHLRRWRWLALLGLLGAGLLALFWRGFAAPRPAPAVAPDLAPSLTRPVAVAAPSPELAPAPGASPFALMASARAGSAPAAASSTQSNAARAKPVPGREPMPASKAAKDGLSDQNPFAN
jgi:serine/threonine-protein kinase